MEGDRASVAIRYRSATPLGVDIEETIEMSHDLVIWTVVPMDDLRTEPLEDGVQWTTAAFPWTDTGRPVYLRLRPVMTP